MPKSFPFCLLTICFLILVIYYNMAREDYNQSMTFDEMIDSYFKGFNLDDVKWKIIREEEYNDRVSFLDIGVDDVFNAKLCFTLEKYNHRDELRLVLIENINNDEWKNKLQKKNFLLIEKT